MAARASSSFCTSATAAGRARHLRQRVRRLGANADAVVQRRRDERNHLGPLEPADRANRRRARPLPLQRLAQRREAGVGRRPRIFGLQHPLLQRLRRPLSRRQTQARSAET